MSNEYITKYILNDVSPKQITEISKQLQKQVVAKLFHLADNDVHIQKSKYGKPYYENDISWHYNVSHHKGTIVFICSLEEIGVDILSTTEKKLETIKRYMSPNEQSQAKCDNDIRRFWTLKESYIKAIGTGLSTFPDLKRIEFHLIDDNYATLAIDKTWTFYTEYIYDVLVTIAYKQIPLNNVDFIVIEH